MALVPKPGLVVQYDFLWKEESATAHEHGTKDRPCAIVLTTKEREDGSKDVCLCAITHLYVACTRARDHLLVTGVGPASEFLEDLRMNE